MKYTIRLGESVSDEIKRIVEGKIEAGIEYIDGNMDRHETVHEVRKPCKEVRAAARLVRPVLPTYSEMNAHYRDAARRISDIRDAHAAIETFDDHVQPAAEDDGRLSADTVDGIRETLVNRREEVAAEQDLDQRLATVRADLIEDREHVPSSLSPRMATMPSPVVYGSHTNGHATGCQKRTKTLTSKPSTSGASGSSTIATTPDYCGVFGSA